MELSFGFQLSGKTSVEIGADFLGKFKDRIGRGFYVVDAGGFSCSLYNAATSTATILMAIA